MSNKRKKTTGMKHRLVQWIRMQCVYLRVRTCAFVYALETRCECLRLATAELVNLHICLTQHGLWSHIFFSAATLQSLPGTWVSQVLWVRRVKLLLAGSESMFPQNSLENLINNWLIKLADSLYVNAVHSLTTRTDQQWH